jgi:oxalate decarboxylase
MNKNTIYSSSTHFFDLDGAMPQFSSATGSRTIMNADNFPILSGMGAALLRLQKGAVREPHWHPNAAELSYCIGANAKITIYGTDAHTDTFTIKPGEIVFIPKGYWHDIENIGNEQAKFVIVYDNEHTQELGMSGSVGSMPARVLDRLFGIRNSPGFFDQLEYNKSPQDIIIGQKPVVFSSTTGSAGTSNSHKFNLAGITPQIQTPGGTGALGTANSFPILKGLALFLIDLKPGGIIEPHTHPNADELNYVISGKARCTIFSPGGNVETSEISQGQVFFVPAGYFHYLENPDDLNDGVVASFFGNERPEFIGVAGGLSAYSDEVLGSIFNKDPKFFSNLPRLHKNLLLASGTG